MMIVLMNTETTQKFCLTALERQLEILNKNVLGINDLLETYKKVIDEKTKELNKYKEASKLFEELTKDYPEKYEYLYSLSECFYFLNDLKKAIAPLDKLEEAIGLNEDLILYTSVNAGYKSGENGFETEIEQFGKCFGTEDFKEGTQAFLEKSPANFSGN